jgi:hypothetical protein
VTTWGFTTTGYGTLTGTCTEKDSRQNEIWVLRRIFQEITWERHFDFLDNWDFDLLVDWIFLNMMVMNSVNVIWNGNLDVFAVKLK